MMCSIPPEKSSSNWLDRLRSNKGFPASGDFTLDHFLTNPTVEEPSDSPKPDVSASNSNINSSNSGETSAQIGERDWFGAMNHVLSDLFIMGGPTVISRTKSARKQTNPKFFPLPPPPEDEKAAIAVASSFDSDHNSNINDDYSGGGDDEMEEDKYKDDRFRAEGRGGDDELKGYSRSEVTVIDTSYEVWKFDKLVFRKKNDWKVRDKKGRSWLSAATRKRKKGSGGLESESGGAKKKKSKVFSSHASSSIAVTNGGNCASQFDDNPHHEKMEDVSKEVADDLISQVPKHRQVYTWEMFHGSSEVSEKLIFSKKNVWKLRDKKDKPWMSATKKKKNGIGALRSESNHHGIVGGVKKKAKVFNSHVGSSSFYSNGRNCESPFDNAQNEDEMMEDAPREVADELLSQVPKHRQVYTWDE
ncbi:hypothetical protein LINPERHAP2_LOCUS29206 [Linum perenne]